LERQRSVRPNSPTLGTPRDPGRPGIVAVLVGGALVFLVFPRADAERRLVEAYHREDAAGEPAPEAGSEPAPAPARAS
jgi:hypothetical protein